MKELFSLLLSLVSIAVLICFDDSEASQADLSSIRRDHYGLSSDGTLHGDSLENALSKASRFALSRLKLPLSPAPIKKLSVVDRSVPRVIRMPAILIDFANNAATIAKERFDTLLFVRGQGKKSLADYWYENSFGDSLIQGTSTGWYRAQYNDTVYTSHMGGLQGSGLNVESLVREALQLADASLNYAIYDNDADGTVEGIFIVHSGRGSEASGNLNHFWSHVAELDPPYVTNDGVVITRYLLIPEKLQTTFYSNISTVGVPCQLFGTYLGLPMLYDTGTQKPGLGNWSLMATGSWNGFSGASGSVPASLDAWSKNVLDSLYGNFGETVDVFLSNLPNVQLQAASSSPIRYRVHFSTGDRREYFPVECRARVTGTFDHALPSSGILVYHCDDHFSGNNNSVANGRLHVALVQADGLTDLEIGNNNGDGGDPFPGSSLNSSFTPYTNPAATSLYATPSQVNLRNISYNSVTQTAQLEINTILAFFARCSESRHLVGIRSHKGNDHLLSRLSKRKEMVGGESSISAHLWIKTS